MTAAGNAGGSDPAPAAWRILIALALIGAALGLAWGVADQARYRATATVAVESDSQGSDQARLERFAQRGESDEVATRAAGLLGNDIPGADLLADVSVRPSPRGGFLIVTADADAPDVAAAAADGFQRAIVAVEGDPLALGAAATIPATPFENRSAPLWAAIGLAAGLLLGLIVVAVLRLSRRHRAVPGGDPAPGAGPADAAWSSGFPAPDAPPVERGGDVAARFAERLGATVAELHPGPDGAIVSGRDGVAIVPAAAPDVGMLADRLTLRTAGGPRSVALTAVGAGADAVGLAAALAVAAAGTGRRVLLVDADLGVGELAGRLGVAPAPGLHDYLEGFATPQAVLRGIEAGGGFAAVPAGSAGPVARVAGERFSELVGRLGRAYELVLYAAPPLLGSEDADAVVEVVDAVVPLVGPGARPGEADQAAELLEGISVETVVAVVR